MEIMCDKCDFVINKDKYEDGFRIEEYKNVYGTLCPNCGHIIKPISKPKFVQNYEINKMKLQFDFLEILRKKLRRN